MAHIHFKRNVQVDPSLRAAVEQSFALLSEEYSVSISLREGTDDWSVQVVGPASVVAGGSVLAGTTSEVAVPLRPPGCPGSGV